MIRQEEIEVGNIFKLRTLALTNYFLTKEKNGEGGGLVFIRTYEEFTILEVIRERDPGEKYVPKIHLRVMVLDRDDPIIGWLTFHRYSDEFSNWDKIL